MNNLNPIPFPPFADFWCSSDLFSTSKNVLFLSPVTISFLGKGPGGAARELGAEAGPREGTLLQWAWGKV